jgi:transposase
MPAGVITLPVGTQIWIAAGVTDLRSGFTRLSTLIQTQLEQNPFKGQVFLFRGRRGDLIKVLIFRVQPNATIVSNFRYIPPVT